MGSLLRLASITATTLRPTSFFSNLKPHARLDFHTRIFAMPHHWQRAPFVRQVSITANTPHLCARNAVFLAATKKDGQIQFDQKVREFLPKTYPFLKKESPSQADCLMGLLVDVSLEKPYNKEDGDWKKLQKLVNELEPSVIVETFQRLYLECSFEGKIDAIYPTMALFKLFTGHLLTLPKQEVCSLDHLRENFKESVLSLPFSNTNLRRLLEFFICIKPLNLRSLFWFYLPEELVVDFQKLVKGYDDSIL